MTEENIKEKQSAGKADVKGRADQLEGMLDEYMVKKAPFQIPTGGKGFIANVSPYLVIIGAVMFVPVLLAMLGISAFLSPFVMMGGGYGGMMSGGYGMMVGWGLGGMISLAVGIAAFGLEVAAVPGLFKRTKSAWRLMYYATLVSLAGSILSFNIVGGIIGAIIGWYILFQVKELYKN